MVSQKNDDMRFGRIVMKNRQHMPLLVNGNTTGFVWSKMVNGLHLCSALSSPRSPKCFTIVSHPPIHTLTVVGYIIATAALGHTDRSRAAIQLVPPGPLTTISRHEG
ncbi:hypothetical protein AMECASPLE_025685 [Ameca splendens]|uniref:Uncharacterized protein n=1 Tax=Ameca splendens TaxID=208324 RepID=A0ABV0YRY0_9TELE